MSRNFKSTKMITIFFFFSFFSFRICTANVVSEESILKWYKDGHSQKGKMHFLEQMKKFVEWLENAEEESDSEEEDWMKKQLKLIIPKQRQW